MTTATKSLPSGSCVPLSATSGAARQALWPAKPDLAPDRAPGISQVMPLIRASVLALSCLLGTSPILAQTGSGGQPTQPADSRAKASITSCQGAAVFSAGSGPEVHVMRQGILDQRNPLSSLSDAPPAIVLEVTIRGKLAAAYGPSFEQMRRAGPPQDLERETGNAIEWTPDLNSLPRDILIAGDHGEVIAKLRFIRCAPRARATPAGGGRATQRRTDTPAPVNQKPPAINLPKGAIE